MLFALLILVFFQAGFGQYETQQEIQNRESFYESLLLSGEEAFFLGDYEKAIRELEIAAFGLFHRKLLAGKAYILMSLSSFYLEDRDSAGKFLREAAQLLSEKELLELELNIDDSDKEVLESMIRDFDVFGATDTVDSETEEKSPPLEKSQKLKQEEKKPSTPVKKEPEKKEAEMKEQMEMKLLVRAPDKKKIPETVEERIAQLKEERKQKETETAETKPPKKSQTKESEIEGLEELFILDEPAQDWVLSEIWIQKDTDSLEIEILFKPYTQHSVFEIIDIPPNRIVIDIQNITKIEAARSTDIYDFGIASIRTGQFKPSTARVVLDAIGNLPPYTVEKTDEGLKVVIKRSPL